MIKEGHKTYEYCKRYNDLMDLALEHAESCIDKWANQEANETELKYDIELATCLLIDNLLPDSARVALGHLILKTLQEARERKLTIENLGIRIKKPGRGRKKRKDTTNLVDLYIAILKHRTPKSGLKTLVYNMVAEKTHASPDTIRRDYERYKKRIAKLPPSVFQINTEKSEDARSEEDAGSEEDIKW